MHAWWAFALVSTSAVLRGVAAAPALTGTTSVISESDIAAAESSIKVARSEPTALSLGQKTATIGSSIAVAGPYVHLGYEKKIGVTDNTTLINSFKGIRYAKAPIGNLRWQPPQFPDKDLNSSWVVANEFGASCPQSFVAVPDAPFIPGNEDCLFLNVYAPTNIKTTGWYLGPKLPVLIWIHGGGYGIGDGSQDVIDFIQANGNNMIVVTIQYRLGAFGFLASEEVVDRGVANAGLLDQKLAMEWVQRHIWKFGGDKTKVTISGESAGAGSVMLHSIADGGSLGTSLFRAGIAASPYLPGQYAYNDAYPTSKYYELSEMVGCGSSGDVFDCLQTADSMALQQASNAISISSTYGTWAFYPVTEPNYITVAPSTALFSDSINGKYLLVSNNANEGPLFVPPIITTEADLLGWLSLEFPNLSVNQLNEILIAYPINENYTTPMETDGLSPPTANEVSQSGTGQQQRGNNILAEATFVCPSYWLAEAFSASDRVAYHYQFSVPFAWHTTDINAYFGPKTDNLSDEFMLAMRKIWGNFVATGNPSITDAEANGEDASTDTTSNPASAWPTWNPVAPQMLNLNITGGVPYETFMQWGVAVTQYAQPGLVNSVEKVDAAAWEGGRGNRCDFWKDMGPAIPQ